MRAFRGRLSAEENFELFVPSAGVPEFTEELRSLGMTEADFAAGKVESVDWSEAKKELRRRFE